MVYTAALIDGEGSVLLSHAKPAEHRSPVVTVPSTTWCFMTFLKSTFGGNISSKKRTKKHHSKSWNWSVRYNRAIDVLRRVLPYMKHPEKRRRARLIVEQFKLVTKRSGRYTVPEAKKKAKFERLFLSRSTRTHVND